MTDATYSLKLPASVVRAAERLAKEDGVSLDQFVTAAVAQKIGTLEAAAAFFKQRATGAAPGEVLEVLRNVPAVPPQEGDELPPELARKWTASESSDRA